MGDQGEALAPLVHLAQRACMRRPMDRFHRPLGKMLEGILLGHVATSVGAKALACLPSVAWHSRHTVFSLLSSPLLPVQDWHEGALRVGLELSSITRVCKA